MSMDKLQGHNLLGVDVHALSFAQTLERVKHAVDSRVALSVAFFASYSLIAAIDDPHHQRRLNAIDLKVCDGQPVRWALNHFYNVNLRARVSGPQMLATLLAEAESANWPVYFYGANPPTLERMQIRLAKLHPHLVVAGIQPGRYTRISREEQAKIVRDIRDSGARLVFVGLGTPRQDTWLYENTASIGVPCLAMGAAFDYFAGDLTPAPRWMALSGLEWLYRVFQEPKRLWRRYLTNNTRYVLEVLRQELRGPRPPSRDGAIDFVGDA